LRQLIKHPSPTRGSNVFWPTRRRLQITRANKLRGTRSSPGAHRPASGRVVRLIRHRFPSRGRFA
jgi:hypothetical protein